MTPKWSFWGVPRAPSGHPDGPKNQFSCRQISYTSALGRKEASWGPWEGTKRAPRGHQGSPMGPKIPWKMNKRCLKTRSKPYAFMRKDFIKKIFLKYIPRWLHKGFKSSKIIHIGPSRSWKNVRNLTHLCVRFFLSKIPKNILPGGFMGFKSSKISHTRPSSFVMLIRLSC